MAATEGLVGKFLVKKQQLNLPPATVATVVTVVALEAKEATEEEIRGQAAATAELEEGRESAAAAGEDWEMEGRTAWDPRACDNEYGYVPNQGWKSLVPAWLAQWSILWMLCSDLKGRL